MFDTGFEMPPETFRQYTLPSRQGFDCLTLREVPTPSPGLGHVLIRIKAVSLNWRDGIIAQGTYPWTGPFDELVPGSDGAGKLYALCTISYQLLTTS